MLKMKYSHVQNTIEDQTIIETLIQTSKGVLGNITC